MAIIWSGTASSPEGAAEKFAAELLSDEFLIVWAIEDEDTPDGWRGTFQFFDRGQVYRLKGGWLWTVEC